MTADIYDAIAGLDRILAAAAGSVDLAVAYLPDEDPAFTIVAYRQCPDGTDEEIAVAHAGSYIDAHVAIYEALAEAGYEAVTT